MIGFIINLRKIKKVQVQHDLDDAFHTDATLTISRNLYAKPRK